MGGSGVPRRMPITAFGGEIRCRFAAGTSLPGAAARGTVEAPPIPPPIALGETANG